MASAATGASPDATETQHLRKAIRTNRLSVAATLTSLSRPHIPPLNLEHFKYLEYLEYLNFDFYINPLLIKVFLLFNIYYTLKRKSFFY
jgi:hypothetical protein